MPAGSSAGQALTITGSTAAIGGEVDLAIDAAGDLLATDPAGDPLIVDPGFVFTGLTAAVFVPDT